MVVDSGYMATEVYDQCCKFGWTAFKGEDRESFAHYYGDGTRVLRAYSAMLAGDPGIGTSSQGQRNCTLFLWSNPMIKDILFRLKRFLAVFDGVKAPEGASWK